jgi:sensor histidine kinase YesM
LVKLRESKAQLLEHFRKDTEKVVSLLREKIIIMAVDRNQRVQESINQSLLRLFFVFFALIFITFILGCFFYVFLMHVITQPLVRLTEKVQRFSLLGDDGGGGRVSPRGCIEVKNLMESFQELIMTIQEKENLCHKSRNAFHIGF